MRHLCCVLVLAALVPFSRAHAQIDRPLRLGAGVGVGIGGGGAQFLIAEDIDYRLLPSDLGSLFIGAELGQGISSAFLFQFGARAGYDFRLWHNQDLEFLLAPEIMVGAAVAAVANGAIGYFDLQVGAEARLVFLQGLLVAWLRPLAFDFFIQEATFVRYDLLAGMSVQF